MTKENSTAYTPGVCNINSAEVAYRKKAGYIGAAVFVILLILLLLLDINRWSRLVLFAPAFVAVIGFLQAKNKFCVAYGSSGKQNAAEESSESKSIKDAGAIIKDKIKAKSMNLQAAIIALAATLMVCLI